MNDYVQWFVLLLLKESSNHFCWDTFHIQHSTDSWPPLRVKDSTHIFPTVIFFSTDDLQRSVLEVNKSFSLDSFWSIIFGPREGKFNTFFRVCIQLSEAQIIVCQLWLKLPQFPPDFLDLNIFGLGWIWAQLIMPIYFHHHFRDFSSIQ